MSISYDSLTPAEIAREKIVALGINQVKTNIRELSFGIMDDGSVGVKVDKSTLSLSKNASTQISNLTGVNRRNLSEYMENRELVSSMIKHSLSKRSGEIQIMYNKDGIYNVSSGLTEHIHPLQVFDVAAETIGPDKFKVDTVSFDKGRVGFKFVTAFNKNPNRRVGDYTHGGIFIESNGYVSVSPYLLRLVCTNGMVRNSVYPDMAKDIQTVKSYVSNTVSNMIEQSQKDLDIFVSLDDHTVDNPYAMFVRASREIGLSDRFARRISEVLPSMEKHGESYTYYDMLNLVSSLANSTGNNRYQAIAGNFMDSFRYCRCENCGSKLVESDAGVE